MLNQLKQKNPNRFKIFLVVILLSLSFIIAQIAITMTGEDIRAIRGAIEVPYSVYLDNNESVAGFQVEVNYTDYLSYNRIEATSRMENATIVVNNETSGSLKIAVLIEEEINSGEDVLFNIIFYVDEFAVTGNYTMSLSNLVAANINASIVPSETTDGNFEIVEPYNVTFLPPISNFENFTLQDGATLPFKFNVTDENGFVSDYSVLVRIYNLSLGIDQTYNASGTGDGYIEINSSNHYHVNIHTNDPDMPIGLYNIEVSFDNFQIEEIGFELVDKSNGIGKGKQK